MEKGLSWAIAAICYVNLFFFFYPKDFTTSSVLISLVVFLFWTKKPLSVTAGIKSVQ